ncbi:hypothetical protein [Clavibacter californiensis]|uniref:hypothetical protein n=1 Tax=Clavibacter californiensis TaxID=1401995 RepID=UPI0015F82F25|nr:hypothetical protein [Clavibacter californiensis]
MNDTAPGGSVNAAGRTEVRTLTPEWAAELYQPRDEPVPLTVYARPDGTPYIKVRHA